MRDLSFVPLKISVEILNFCKTITSCPPVYIFTKVIAGTLPGECFSNVDTYIVENGGSKQYGWIIWQNANHVLSAEFHSVYVDSYGVLLDLTPYTRCFEKILFLPDNIKKYENTRVKTKYHPISNAQEVQPFIHAIEALSLLEEYMGHSSVREKINSPECEKQRNELNTTLSNIEIAIQKYEKMALGSIGRNDPCFCGSEKKLKNCCGRNF